MAGSIPRYNRDSVVKKIADISAATTTELIATPGSGNIIQILSLSIISKADNTVTLKSAANAISPAWEWGTSGGGVGLGHHDNGWMVTADNEALNVTTASANKVNILILYRLARV